MKDLMSLIKRFIYRLRADYTTEDLVKMGLRVGSNFLRMHGTILDPSHRWLIKIGDNVTLAPRVHILAHDASTCHHLGYAKIGRVDIGNNVFIGAESVVLPGVSIGNNVVVAGNPARVICSIEEYIEKNKIRMANRPVYGEEYTLRYPIDEAKKRKQQADLKSGIGFVK